MSTSYLDLNGLGYLWGKAKDKFASKDIEATDIEAVGISEVTNEGNPVEIDSPYEQEAEDVIVEFEPIQDLHGYDHPWPAGGGKNLWTFGDITTSASGVPFALESGTYTFSLTSSSNTATFGVRLYYNDSDNVLVSPSAQNDFKVTFNLTSDVIKLNYSATNGTATNVQLEKGSTATSYAPYSNICPISGRTGVGVVRCGKNLFDITKIIKTSYAGVTIEQTNNTLHVYGTGISNAGFAFGNFHLEPGSYVYASVSGDIPLALLKGYSQISNTIPTAFDVSSASDTYRLRLQIVNGTTYDFYISDIQIEEGSTATPYEPYQAESYDIEFPSEAGTVYGGTLDVKSGVLTVDRAIVDLGTLSWNYETNNSRFRTSSTVSGIKARTSSAQSVEGLACSIYEANPAPITGASKDMTIASVNAYLYIRDSRYTDAIAYKTAMSGVQLCYELATPITYQLTPHQLTLLKKYNVITSDASNIRITYDGKSDSTIQSELDELNETIFMIKQSISNSQIDNMFDALNE